MNPYALVSLLVMAEILLLYVAAAVASYLARRREGARVLNQQRYSAQATERHPDWCQLDQDHRAERELVN